MHSKVFFFFDFDETDVHRVNEFHTGSRRWAIDILSVSLLCHSEEW